MDIDTVPGIIEAYEQGVYTRLEMHALLGRLVTFDTADELISSMRPDIREDFIRWARQTFDNDVPVEDFVSIGGEGGFRHPDAMIPALRDWLRRHPALPSED